MVTKIDTTLSGPVELATPSKRFYNYYNQPPKPVQVSDKPSKTQLSPLDAKSPQELLDQHGMYRKESVYQKNPEMIYGDFSELGDYEKYLNDCIAVENKFAKLDPEVRGRFNNSVIEFANAVRSKDFNIHNVLTSKESEALKSYEARIEADKKQAEYLNSAEYKQLQKQAELRQQYESSKYQEWLNSQTNKS